jgi:hypothetical protein
MYAVFVENVLFGAIDSARVFLIRTALGSTDEVLVAIVERRELDTVGLVEVEAGSFDFEIDGCVLVIEPYHFRFVRIRFARGGTRMPKIDTIDINVDFASNAFAVLFFMRMLEEDGHLSGL